MPFKQQSGNKIIYRIEVPQHGNNFIKQIFSFYHFQKEAAKLIAEINPQFIVVSTSKLFTAYFAKRIAEKHKIQYYLDLRDLFAENLSELIKIPVLNTFVSWWVKTFIEKPVLLNARHINVNSKAFIQSIPEKFKGSVSFYPNGIDDEFSSWKQEENLSNEIKTVCYAGNIGIGQGLEKIIPIVAKSLDSTHHFKIIGEGSSRTVLQKMINSGKIKNVTLIPPMPRRLLLEHYKKAHYLFLHLNNFKSFEKVLPSKIFEYGSGNIPVLAGVKGYAREFINNELKENVFVFDPCDSKSLVDFLKSDNYHLSVRTEFVHKYNRKKITDQMSDSILSIIHACEES
jgi:hypothetical protein